MTYPLEIELVRAYTWFTITARLDLYHVLDNGHALCSSRIEPYTRTFGSNPFQNKETLVNVIARTHTNKYASIYKRCLKRINPTEDEITQANEVAAQIEADAKEKARKRSIREKAKDKLAKALITGNSNIVTCPTHGGKWRINITVVSYDEPGNRWPADYTAISLPCGCQSPYRTYDMEHCAYRLEEVTKPSITL